MSARAAFLLAAAAMAAVVAASNVLVRHPVEQFGLADYLTWGAFTYPLAFLVTDLANRRLGPAQARRVVLVGFAAAVALSVVLATPRIAIASGAAFLAAQLLDVAIFDRLRGGAWWTAPLVSSAIASAFDTAIFFTLAFSCAPIPGGPTISEALGAIGVADACAPDLPWTTWAVVDYAVKLALAGLALLPYGAALALMREGPGARAGA